MSRRQPRYSPEEFATRGQEIFERRIAPLVKQEDPGKFVGIDIETEEFEVDENSMSATERLIEKNPDAQIWMRRVGFPWTHRFGMVPRRTGRSVLRKIER